VEGKWMERWVWYFLSLSILGRTMGRVMIYSVQKMVGAKAEYVDVNVSPLRSSVQTTQGNQLTPAPIDLKSTM
jgi:hypothetical protein